MTYHSIVDDNGALTWDIEETNTIQNSAVVKTAILLQSKVWAPHVKSVDSNSKVQLTDSLTIAFSVFYLSAKRKYGVIFVTCKLKF